MIFHAFTYLFILPLVCSGCGQSHQKTELLKPKGAAVAELFGRGFDIRIYTGPRDCRKSIQKQSLLLAGWGEDLMGRVQVADPNFSISLLGPIQWGAVYAEQITVSNFTMIVRGVFRPKKNGTHTFHMTASSAGLFRIGDIEGSETQYDMISRNTCENKSYSLRADRYYPIHIGYINQFDDAQLKVECSTEGKSVDLGEQVFHGVVNRADLGN